MHCVFLPILARVSMLSLKSDISSHNHILQVLSESCPHLTSLKLSHCTGVTDKAFQSLAGHCKQLESIDVQNSEVSSASIIHSNDNGGLQK